MTHQEISNQTKRSLSKALRQRMAEGPLETISVRELTNACNLDRHTFYYHFRDIFGLLEWMYQQDSQEIMQLQQTAQDWEQKLRILIHYLRDNKSSCRCAMDSAGSKYFNSFIYGVTHNMQWDVLVELDRSCGIPLDEELLEFLNHFYASAYVGVLKSFIREEFHISDEVFLQRLLIMQEDNRTGAVQRLRTDEIR